MVANTILSIFRSGPTQLLLTGRREKAKGIRKMVGKSITRIYQSIYNGIFYEYNEYGVGLTNIKG